MSFRGHELVLSYTLKCNLLCEHCIANAGPNRTEKMDFERAKEYIEKGAQAGIKSIAFTGGEPTLFLNEIVELIKISKNNKLYSVLVSNCAWAVSDKATFELLDKLKKAGIDEIQISADSFHQKLVPFENVIRVVSAAKEMEIKLVVIMAILNDDIEAEKMKKRLIELGVKVKEQSIAPFGRASQLKRNRLIIVGDIDKIPEGMCRSAMSHTVTCDNKLLICCGADLEPTLNNMLLVGDLNKETIEVLLGKLYDDLVYKALYVWGPKKIYRICEKELKESNFEPRKEYFNVCDLCYHLMTMKNYEVIKKCLSRDDLKQQIEVAYAIKDVVADEI